MGVPVNFAGGNPVLDHETLAVSHDLRGSEPDGTKDGSRRLLVAFGTPKHVLSLCSRARKGSDFHSFYKQDFAGICCILLEFACKVL